MTNLKSIFISSFAIALLSGCGASKKVYDISALAVKAPLNVTKKSPLTKIELNRWSHLDIEKDTIPGMSVDKAYAELLKDKIGKKVIVGIVDSGVDIEHEDLKSVIWTNKKEIAANGIDDDKNGYIDDIDGWNFLGDIVKENIEYERIIANKNLVDEATYLAAKALNDKKIVTSTTGKTRLETMIKDATKAIDVLTNHFGKSDYSIDEVKAINSTDKSVARGQRIFQHAHSFNMTLQEFNDALQKEVNGYSKVISGENLKTNYRTVLGDNPDDFTNKKYGDNKVMGPDPKKEHTTHGTHVAGIVAQVRNNTLGGDGVANNVEILAVRAVPEGDEYDKDIALGIRYAVDNGAKVINASFGKYFSPHKQWVYDAIKYAAKKDVLIIHSAGNESKDNDKEINYPNDHDGQEKEFADNLLTVGALNFELGKNIAAEFSNYGNSNVDVFAPGVNIYATTPNNEYKLLDGTSMASPNAAGVAALIRSYYPKLSAKQVKQILMDSGVAITTDAIVGGKATDVRPFAKLSKSGKIVNAYNALLMAEKMSK